MLQGRRVAAVDLDDRAAGGVVERGPGDRTAVEVERNVAAQRDTAVVQGRVADRARAGDVDVAGDGAAAGRGEGVDRAAVDADIVQRQRVAAVELDGGAAGGVVERGSGDRRAVEVQRNVAAQRDTAVVQRGIADRAGTGDVD